MQRFLIRHIALQASFAEEWSLQEQNLLNEHLGYWKKLQEQGVALVFRPAYEIKGAWGIGIIGTENFSKAQVIAACDPAVKAGLHTIEINPINSIWRQKLDSP